MWYAGNVPTRLSDADLQRCRDRFASWLLWFLDTYPEVAPTRLALAEHLGISGPAVTALLKPGAKRFPSCEVVLRARALLSGFSIDALFFSNPPGYLDDK